MSVKYCLPMSSFEFFVIFCNLLDSFGIFWKYSGFFRIFLQSFGNFWNLFGFFWIWNLLDSFGLFWDLLERCPKKGYFDWKTKNFYKSKTDGLQKFLKSNCCCFFDSKHFRLCPVPSGGILKKEFCKFQFHLTRVK